MDRKNLGIIILGIILISISFSSQNAYGCLEEKEIEKPEDWFIDSKEVDFNENFTSKLNFAFGNTTLGFATYLFFKMEVNAPLNITGYINRKIRKDTSEVGININGSEGYIAMEVNGTILVAVNETINPLDFEVEDVESFTNFSSIIGENLSIPINIKPIKVTIPTEGILPPELLTDYLIVKMQPSTHLEGSISLSANVMNETLTWTSGKEIYFKKLPVDKDTPTYNLSIKNIKYNFSDVKTITDEIFGTLTFGNEVIGDFLTTDFQVDLATANTSEETENNELILFLLDNLLEIEDQKIFISIEKSPFSLSGIILAMVLLTSTYMKYKRRKK